MTTSGFDATRPPGTTPVPTELPDKHGESDDPRYPSPRQLRQAIAFVIDLVLHIAVGVVGMIVCLDIPAVSDWAPLALPIGWILASLLQRVVAQRIFHTTVGKALTGVCVIRPSDGQWPTTGCLLKWWLIGAFDVVGTFTDSTWLGDYDDSPAVVRRRDVTLP
ncbi:RDD family protein [Rhodococcus sp. AG1013]|uniref:RDD family protein n=1 Tax=unclassified Rhodococcus (in: high G+C Gram-positive bacteria) TaxID=192944 RepID=UPI000E0AD9FF|nr:RDD family protein [Rhodococcus sp. AG1013]